MTADADSLERFLGDPFDRGSRMSFAEAVDCDEHERAPKAAMTALREWGFHHFFVPAQWGGRLTSYEELLGLVRAVASRDLTVAIAYGTTLLAANPIWLYGSAEQRAAVVDLILAGELGAFALSEAAHGSDLSANELTATRTAGGLALTGEKWPIGNATRGAFVVVLARTQPTGGPRGFSLFLVDKRRMPPTGWSFLPEVPTLGARGHDLSGIRFDGCVIDNSALVGRGGAGIEQSLGALQLTRTLIAGLSLGVAETALRIAVSWALERKLYGKPIAELPPIRQLLVGSFLDLLICELVTVSTCRAVSIAPDRMSLWSSVAKYFVPLSVERIIRDSAEVLGARHFVRQGVADGFLQKLMRDHSIAAVFEGTALLNLHHICNQLPTLLAAPPSDASLLAELFTLATPAPTWNPERARPTLSNRGRDEVTTLLTDAPEWESERRSLLDEVRLLSDRDRHLWRSHEGFELARRHCRLHAAASCMHMRQHNRAHPSRFLAGGEWLKPCLDRLSGRTTPPDENLWGELRRRFESGLGFSALS